MNKKAMTATTLVYGALLVLFIVLALMVADRGLMGTFDRATDWFDFSERSRSATAREDMVLERDGAREFASGMLNQLENIASSQEDYCFGVIDTFEESFFENDYSIKISSDTETVQGRQESRGASLSLYVDETLLTKPGVIENINPCVVYGEEEAKSLYDEIKDYERGLYPSNIEFTSVESLDFKNWEKIVLEGSEEINYQYSDNYFLYVLKNQNNICFIPVTKGRAFNNVRSCADPSRVRPIIIDIIRPGCLDSELTGNVNLDTLEGRILEHDTFCDDVSREKLMNEES